MTAVAPVPMSTARRAQQAAREITGPFSARDAQGEQRRAAALNQPGDFVPVDAAGGAFGQTGWTDAFAIGSAGLPVIVPGAICGCC
jgi:hypothetical protein